MSTPASAPISFTALAPGFADPVHDSQTVFRTLLDALARPGTTGTIEAPLPAGGAGDTPASPAAHAARAALLALCDDATPVWLAQPDPALDAALRFHAGAPLAGTPAEAVFAYVHDAAALPPLESFATGEPEAPEQSATLLIRVEALSGGAPVTLRGPGIEHSRTLAPLGLPRRFWEERAALASLAPCGLDCYLVCGSAVVGLPRTTHVEFD